MDKSTEEDEIMKLLDVKDIEFIEASELNEFDENDQNTQNTDTTKLISESNGVINRQISETEAKPNGNVIVCTERRSDEPTELSFEKGDQKFFSFSA